MPHCGFGFSRTDCLSYSSQQTSRPVGQQTSWPAASLWARLLLLTVGSALAEQLRSRLRCEFTKPVRLKSDPQGRSRLCGFGFASHCGFGFSRTDCLSYSSQQTSRPVGQQTSWPADQLASCFFVGSALLLTVGSALAEQIAFLTLASSPADQLASRPAGPLLLCGFGFSRTIEADSVVKLIEPVRLKSDPQEKKQLCGSLLL